MLNQFSRLQLLLGSEAMSVLRQKKVAVFGIGGVGGSVCEALARSGIGHFLLIDDDRICLTNINRQIIATFRTVGQYKVDAMKERILQINPLADVETIRCFYLPRTHGEVDLSRCDYVVDAIDTVTAKIDIIEQCQKLGIPVISSMGVGNKLDPTMLEITDIYKTSMCPLARVMRYELRKRHIPALKVLYSKEKPIRPVEDLSISCRAHCVCPPGTKRRCTDRRDIPGSSPFVPPAAGLIIAGEIVRDLTQFHEEDRR